MTKESTFSIINLDLLNLANKCPINYTLHMLIKRKELTFKEIKTKDMSNGHLIKIYFRDF